MSAPSSSIETEPAEAGAFCPPGRTMPQDWGALRRYLSAQGLTVNGETEPRQFAGGLANLNYRIRIDDRDWVLRRPPPGVLPPGANDVAREYRILRGLSPRFPLAPHPLHFCEDCGILGAPFLIMEYREGLVIGGALPDPRLDESACARLGTTMVEILAALHGVDPQAVGLGTLGRPERQLERTIDGWQQRASAVLDDRTPASIARICAWLRKSLPAPGKTALLHNDFKLDNIILDRANLQPRAVIDWDMGTRGDPLLDLATLLSYWAEPGDPPAMHRLNQMPTAQPGFPSRASVVQAYAQRTGIDVSQFHFYRVLALLRLSVVFMQLHARFRRGEVNDERYRGFGELSADLLNFTEDELASNEFK